MVVTSLSPVQLASHTLGARILILAAGTSFPSLGNNYELRLQRRCQRRFYFLSSFLLASSMRYTYLCFFGAGITVIVPLYQILSF